METDIPILYERSIHSGVLIYEISDCARPWTQKGFGLRARSHGRFLVLRSICTEQLRGTNPLRPTRTSQFRGGPKHATGETEPFSGQRNRSSIKASRSKWSPSHGRGARGDQVVTSSSSPAGSSTSHSTAGPSRQRQLNLCRRQRFERSRQSGASRGH
jgi:hypothetical protein